MPDLYKSRCGKLELQLVAFAAEAAARGGMIATEPHLDLAPGSTETRNLDPAVAAHGLFRHMTIPHLEMYRACWTACCPACRPGLQLAGQPQRCVEAGWRRLCKCGNIEILEPAFEIKRPRPAQSKFALTCKLGPAMAEAHLVQCQSVTSPYHMRIQTQRPVVKRQNRVLILRVAAELYLAIQARRAQARIKLGGVNAADYQIR